MFWAELTTPNSDAAARFYESLFGWRIDMDDTGPGLPRGSFVPRKHPPLGTPRQSVAGLQPMSTWQQQQGESARWIPSVHTPDVVAMTERAQFHGATLTEPAMPDHGDGWRARLVDPTGAAFDVWEPAQARPDTSDPSSPRAAASGVVCWMELQTPDPYAARDFYRELMVWRCHDDHPSDEFLGDNVLFAEADQPIARLRTVEPGTGACWLPGFAAEDVDRAAARATSLGGSVAAAPSAGGRPDVRHVTDPFGAAFLIVDAASIPESSSA
jgi:uncharacterized protein